MSDPIPSATADPESVEQLPSNAEDRKAAAALSSLHTNEIATEASVGAPDAANQEALGKAMSRLEITAGQNSNKTGAAPKKSGEEVAKRKVVRVDPADVALLVRIII
jgi:hypothetical protein